MAASIHPAAFEFSLCHFPGISGDPVIENERSSGLGHHHGRTFDDLSARIPVFTPLIIGRIRYRGRVDRRNRFQSPGPGDVSRSI